MTERRHVPATEAASEVPDFVLDADDVIVGVIVLVKTIDGQDHVGLAMKHSPGLDWLGRIGMLSVAHATEREDAVGLFLGHDPNGD